MSGTSPSEDVGSDLIDAYLIAVENALVAAGAPRADRMQVLQNLETQIAEMLAPLPLPFSDEAVRSVIAKLEPPRHFAATYGRGREAAAPAPDRFADRPRFRWPIVSTVSCALLPVGCFLLLLGGAARSHGLALFAAGLLFIGVVLTPLALWSAFKQLRQRPEQAGGRDLLLKSTVAYGVVTPALLMAFLTAATQGFALIPLGIAAFVYVQYMLIRRVWRYMAEALPPQSGPASTGHTNGNGASSPIRSATPMPAM